MLGASDKDLADSENTQGYLGLIRLQCLTHHDQSSQHFTTPISVRTPRRLTHDTRLIVICERGAFAPAKGGDPVEPSRRLEAAVLADAD
jgi:hypothetical protein